jgi:acyl dehydratase
MAHDVYAGKDLGTFDLTITEEMVQHYINGLEEPNPWYTTASPFGGSVAPAIIFQDISSRFKGWYLDNLYGNLWMRQEWKIHAPVRIGQTLHCSARVADRYTKRDREVVAQEVSLKDDAGQLVAWGMHHQSFLPSQTSGGISLRDAKAKEGAKKHVEPTGEPLSLELKKTFTAEMCNQFFYTSRNYHNDKQESEKLGFNDVVVGGRMTLSCITELLTRHFGRGFYLGGHIDVKFVNVLWLNEPFTTRGVITGRRVENGKAWADVAVSCDKADGTKLIVGTASAIEEA